MKKVFAIICCALMATTAFAWQKVGIAVSDSKKTSTDVSISSTTATQVLAANGARTMYRLRTNAYVVRISTYATTIATQGYPVPASSEYIEDVSPYSGAIYCISTDTNSVVSPSENSNVNQ